MTYPFPTRLLLLLPFCAALPMSVGVARADISQEYNFTGTLVKAINGSTSVTGQFTIDFTTENITAFDFTTPVGNLDSPLVFEALSSGGGETTLTIGPANGDSLVLWFDSSLSPFSGNSFDTSLSGLSCPTGAGCTFGGSGFSSGSATPVPEPTSIALLGGVLLLTGIRLRKRPI